MSEKQIEVDGHPGREFVVRGKERGRDLLFNSRVVLVERRLYQMIVVAVDGRKAEHMKEFFDSFQLTNSVPKSKTS